MEKIGLKLSRVELEWLICVVRSLKRLMTNEAANMMAMETVRQIGNRLIALWMKEKKSNILTLSFAEGYILWETVCAVNAANHEVAWQLSIRTQIEKAAERLKTKKLTNFAIQ